MAYNVLQGKLLSVTLGGVAVDCQTDATLTITVATDETDPCKPIAGESSSEASWSDATDGTRSWTISFSAKSFAKSSGFNNADIMKLLIDGSPIVEVQFATTQTTDYDHQEIQVFSGTGIMNNFNLNAPGTGESTYDVDITGKGKPTFVTTPYTT